MDWSSCLIINWFKRYEKRQPSSKDKPDRSSKNLENMEQSLMTMVTWISQVSKKQTLSNTYRRMKASSNWPWCRQISNSSTHKKLKRCWLKQTLLSWLTKKKRSLSLQHLPNKQRKQERECLHMKSTSNLIPSRMDMFRIRRRRWAQAKEILLMRHLKRKESQIICFKMM